MQKKHLLLVLVGATLLCGCNKQAKINSEKIQQLSQNITQLEASQARQMAALQAKLTALAPAIEQMNSAFFEKNHDAAFLYHTNTLYLLLTVDRRIEEHLLVADTERQAHSLEMQSFHTNQLDQLHLYAAQILDGITNRSAWVAEAVNGETRRVGAEVSAEVLKQIKLAALPDAAEIARRQALEADVAQLKRGLETIQAQLAQLVEVRTNNVP